MGICEIWCYRAVILLLFFYVRLRGRRRAWSLSTRLLVENSAGSLRSLRELWWPNPAYESYFVTLRYVLLADLLRNIQVERELTQTLPRRIIFLNPGHIGDLLLMLPAWRGMRKERPSAEIQLVTGWWNGALVSLFAFDGTTQYVAARLLQYNRFGQEEYGFWEELQRLVSLRGSDRDVVLTTGSGPFIYTLMAAMQPGYWGGVNIGMSDRVLRGQANSLPYDKTRHVRETWFELAEQAGLSIDRSSSHLINSVSTAGARDAVAKWSAREARIRVVVAPGAGWPGKRWPGSRFAEVMNAFARKHSLEFILLGTQDEVELCQSIAKQCKVPVINLAGETSLLQVLGILKTAALFLGNDNGLMHLAAAVGVKTVTVWGPTSPQQWGPLGGGHQQLVGSECCEECIPWHAGYECPDKGHPRCMKDIAVDDVVACLETAFALREIE